MPLFKVSVLVEAVVEADDELDAEIFGHKALCEEIASLNSRHVGVKEITTLANVPSSWQYTDLIYHKRDGDVTVMEALIREDDAREAAIAARNARVEETL